MGVLMNIPMLCLIRSIVLSITIALMLAGNASAKDLIIVANIETSERNQTPSEVSKRELRDLFMGTSSKLALTPFALTPSNEIRSVFNTKIIGLTESRIQSYWAQMRFSGKNKPPREYTTTKALISQLVKTENSIAYLPSDAVIPDNLVVLYRTD